MDESYEQLMIATRKQRDNSSRARFIKMANEFFHRFLVLVLVAVFTMRRVVDFVVKVATTIILLPLDLILSISFLLWVRNRSAASSCHLDLTVVRSAFWERHDLVMGAGIRTFFIRPCQPAPMNMGIVTTHSIPTATENPPETSPSLPAINTSKSSKRHSLKNISKRKRRNRWRIAQLKRKNLSVSSLAQQSPAPRTIKRQKLRIRLRKLKHISRTKVPTSGFPY